MNTRFWPIFCFGALFVFVQACESQTNSVPQQGSVISAQQPEGSPKAAGLDDQLHKKKEAAGRRLFDGQTLKGWKSTNFGGEGEVEVAKGAIQLAMGYPMTGVTSTAEALPTDNYEISLDAMRVDGTDFFCGLTFPVDASHCSLIVGGWGGTLVGLSSIDGNDAANNDTMLHMNFENGQWYHLKVRVAGRKVSVWINNKKVIDEDLQGKELSLRNEILPSRPLGICGFQSQCAIKNVMLKRVGTAADSKAPSSEKPAHPAGKELPQKQGK